MSDAVGRRYAKALFELAKEAGTAGDVASSLQEFQTTLSDNDALSGFVNSPVYSREAQMAVMREISAKSKLHEHVGNTLGLMAQKGRLGSVGAMIDAYHEMQIAENDEVVANVVSAKKLTAAQSKKLAKVLKSKVGKDVSIQAEVDPDILGGLVISIGSMMIDNSVKGKLSKLHNAMKEVG